MGHLPGDANTVADTSLSLLLEAASSCLRFDDSVHLHRICTGEVVAALSRRLVMEGIARERVLFCDFF